MRRKFSSSYRNIMVFCQHIFLLLPREEEKKQSDKTENVALIQIRINPWKFHGKMKSKGIFSNWKKMSRVKIPRCFVREDMRVARASLSPPFSLSLRWRIILKCFTCKITKKHAPKTLSNTCRKSFSPIIYAITEKTFAERKLFRAIFELAACSK
jgi:hypothetical protein